jgi:hypothetical protein
MSVWIQQDSLKRVVMRMQKRNSTILGNSRGMISAEFIFALTLCAGICIVFFALTFTLAISEVAQYIAFSVSRAHSAAHIDADKQNQMGQDKFVEILNRPVFKDLFDSKNGTSWFSLDKPIIKGGKDGANFGSDYPISLTEYAAPMTGVKILFKPKILNLKVAFLGSTSENPEEGFSANVTSLIFREPTQNECLDQIKIRNKHILDLSSRYSTLGMKTSDKYVPLEDNGC